MELALNLVKYFLSSVFFAHYCKNEYKWTKNHLISGTARGAFDLILL